MNFSNLLMNLKDVLVNTDYYSKYHYWGNSNNMHWFLVVLENQGQCISRLIYKGELSTGWTDTAVCSYNLFCLLERNVKMKRGEWRRRKMCKSQREGGREPQYGLSMRA